MKTRVKRPRQSKRVIRRGAAVVEFAVVAPILFLLVYSAVEFARVNMIRHTIQNAAYESARRGIVPGATSNNVRAVANDFLASASIGSAIIDITPSTIAPTSAEVVVTITVSLDANGWIAPMFFSGKTVSATCTLEREKYTTLL